VTRRSLFRLPIRARLTLVYSGLVLVAGIALLGVTYALVSQQLTSGPKIVTGAPPPRGQPTPTQQVPSGNPTPPAGENQTLIQQIAEETRRNALTALLTQGGIALAAVCVAATASGWLFAGRLLQPLQRMTETAQRIADAPAADRSLHERIALDGPPDEIKQLADTFDVMLQRLDQSLDGQRRFIANASHELRTPLTLNRAMVELAVHRNRASPEIRQIREVLLEINTRHEHLIDGLLLLARSEREITERSYVDRADIVDYVTTRIPTDTVSIQTQRTGAGSVDSSGWQVRQGHAAPRWPPAGLATGCGRHTQPEHRDTAQETLRTGLDDFIPGADDGADLHVELQGRDELGARVCPQANDRRVAALPRVGELGEEVQRRLGRRGGVDRLEILGQFGPVPLAGVAERVAQQVHDADSRCQPVCVVAAGEGGDRGMGGGPRGGAGWAVEADLG
jgi:HAMP domain-containing protein